MAKKRYHIALEESSAEKLRELSGGERRVGQFISETADWLYTQRDVLEGKPLQELEIVDPAMKEGYKAMQKRLSDVEEMLAFLGMRLDDGGEWVYVYFRRGPNWGK